jgi:nitrogen regulatory protein PII 2
MMKEITFILRSSQWNKTVRELREAGFYAMTRHRAMGRGKQKGLSYGEEGAGVRLLPKWLLILVVEEAQVDAAVAALIRANRTGEIGDGKIFISPVVATQRVRTDEIGYPALC